MSDDGSSPVPAAPPPHARSAEDILGALETTPEGLSQAEAAGRLRRYGPNRLPEAPGKSPLKRFLLQFHNVLIYVLIASAAVTAGMGHFVDTGIILAVVIVNAVLGFIQEGRAERAMEAIHRMLAPRAAVLRDGLRRSVDAAEVVPGDIVLLEAGDRVPADLRLLAATGLSVQEAILTGESVPVEKGTAPVSDGAALGDRVCMAWSGTLVTAGTGRGVATATGAGTEIGRISGLLSRVEPLTTPLVRQMNWFARWLSVLILILAGLLVLVGHFIRHLPLDEMLMVGIGVAVAAIPEGLPAVLTVTLAMGVQAMARRNAIVRRLPAIETLGAVSVICTDKTGTLTRNEMMVTSVATAQGRYRLDGIGYAPEGQVQADGPAPDPEGDRLLAALAFAAEACNDSEIVLADGRWSVEGDPMEGALLAMAGKLGGRIASRPERLAAIPFDSRHRYMAVMTDGTDMRRVVSVKGAPERVLAMCGDLVGPDGSGIALDAEAWNRLAHDIAAEGQRVLAFAGLELPGDHEGLTEADLAGKLSLIGLAGLIDPPRPEAVTAVAECRAAGIRVKMITGDHSGTAAAIGRQIGLANPDRVLTGIDIDEMNDADLAAEVIETDVFARTSPEHKLRLVMALQSHNLVVAMTGDGVNDAPALKRADAGIAMGQKGSEAAREAAEIVLADDNFASIAAAVREGRTVYDNIKKVIAWTLPTNAGEAMTIVAALLLSLSLPVTAAQILWVNLVTAITLGLALAFEPTEGNTMRRPPRARDEPILSGALIWHVVYVSALFVASVFGIYSYATNIGHPEALARTMAVNTLVVLEIFHLFYIRNIYGTSLTLKGFRGTPIVWACVIAVTALQFAFTYLPPLQAAFGTSAVPLRDGALIVAVGMVFFALLEVEKQLRLTVAQQR